MQTFKCKICGGNFDIEYGQKVVECAYCGVKQTISFFNEPKIQEIYNRANAYLTNNEFDKAENLFSQILFDDKQNADAYWNILMCHYGVSYVKDPLSNKYIPTCNRTLYTPIFNDENYKNAIRFATEEQKHIFQENAKTIDEIQKGIIAVSKHEKPFDIFISYKETDANGTRTNDSIAAQELYNKLTEAGYKVFFSRITLEDKIGSEYEPYIYAALASSKVMITVCSSSENIEAVWVKNEWSRFLSFAAKDSNKTIIPLYFDMDKANLPDEFANLSAYNMKANGFEQELIRGIKKLIPTPIVLQERRKKRNKILKISAAVATICLVIGVICAIPWLQKLPDYNAAMELYYDGSYAEATWAFAEMGTYRDSEEMKAKCADSWRKSVATVAYYNDIGSSDGGSYYISPNGTVKTFDVGQDDTTDDITEHGKIISLGGGMSSHRLYEDGYLAGYNEDDNLENIIQVTHGFNNTAVALRDDGTLVFTNELQSEYNDDDTDSWLAPAASWEKIVKIDCYINRFGYGGLMDAALVGIDVDGNVFAVAFNSEEGEVRGIETLQRFTDVKEFDIYVSSDYSETERQIVKYLNMTAITTDNTILTSIDGEYSEEEANNIVDVKMAMKYTETDSILETYYVFSDGKLQKKDKNISLLEDVVYISEDYLITRSGNIYQDVTEPQKTDGKTKVHTEWTERMN